MVEVLRVSWYVAPAASGVGFLKTHYEPIALAAPWLACVMDASSGLEAASGFPVLANSGARAFHGPPDSHEGSRLNLRIHAVGYCCSVRYPCYEGSPILCYYALLRSIADSLCLETTICADKGFHR